MKIHEYQAKAILQRHGVPVPRGEVAFQASEAGEIARRLGGRVVVVKAQIHAGGRGKGGGVKLARSPEDAEKLARYAEDTLKTILGRVEPTPPLLRQRELDRLLDGQLALDLGPTDFLPVLTHVCLGCSLP